MEGDNVNKMKITTNRGKLFDWYLNLRINSKLWFYKIDDKDRAIEVAGKVLRKYQ